MNSRREKSECPRPSSSCVELGWYTRWTRPAKPDTDSCPQILAVCDAIGSSGGGSGELQQIRGSPDASSLVGWPWHAHLQSLADSIQGLVERSARLEALEVHLPGPLVPHVPVFQAQSTRMVLIWRRYFRCYLCFPRRALVVPPLVPKSLDKKAAAECFKN